MPFVALDQISLPLSFVSVYVAIFNEFGFEFKATFLLIPGERKLVDDSHFRRQVSAIDNPEMRVSNQLSFSRKLHRVCVEITACQEGCT